MNNSQNLPGSQEIVLQDVDTSQKLDAKSDQNIDSAQTHVNTQDDELTHFELFDSEFELGLSQLSIGLSQTNGLDSQMIDQIVEQSALGSELTDSALEKHKKTLETISLQMQQFSADENEREIKAESDAFPNVLVDDQLLEDIKNIPDRFGFKIGDVADLLGIKQYVLRYWEQEFDLLKPKKASNNQRFYTKKDVENAFLIKKLLYRDKFSIEGARQALKDVKFVVKKEKNKEKDFSQVIQRMDFVQDQIKNFVNEIRKTKKFFN
ncbi:MAG: MerR family transcriptional regulator [Pseudobdellovibrio sp.]